MEELRVSFERFISSSINWPIERTGSRYHDERTAGAWKVFKFTLLPTPDIGIAGKIIPQSNIDALEEARLALHEECEGCDTDVLVKLIRITEKMWKITHKKYPKYGGGRK